MRNANSTEDIVSSRRGNLSKGYAAVFATVVIWSVPSLFQYYLNRYYDPWAQNFYRYSVACVAIAPLVFYRIRRGGPKIDLRAVGLCLLPCLPNVVHQITQVMALFYMGPGVYAIFTRSSVIFTALLALVFFPEERHIIRQWQFQVGTFLGLVGAFGVIWFQTGTRSLAVASTSGGGQDRHIALPGLFIAFTATFCWALYGVLVKRPSAQLGSIRSFGLVSFITSMLLAAAHDRFWKDRHAAACGHACQLDADYLGGELHHPGPRACITWPFTRSESRSPKHSSYFVRPALLRSRRGSSANGSFRPSSGVRLFCSLAPSSRCERNRWRQRNRRKTSRMCRGPCIKGLLSNSAFDTNAATTRGEFGRALTSFQRLGFAHQVDKSGAITIRVVPLPFLRPLQHCAKRSVSFVFGIAQDHSKLGHRRSELQIGRRFRETQFPYQPTPAPPVRSYLRPVS